MLIVNRHLCLRLGFREATYCLRPRGGSVALALAQGRAAGPRGTRFSGN